MFVLVFQNSASEAEEIRWVTPQEMSDRITELIEAANSPEGQAGEIRCCPSVPFFSHKYSLREAMAVENQKRLVSLADWLRFMSLLSPFPDATGLSIKNGV